MSIETECSICLEKINKFITELECGHIFHSKCIHNFIIRSDENNCLCPNCRRPIIDKEDENEEVIEEDYEEINDEQEYEEYYDDILKLLSLQDNESYSKYTDLWVDVCLNSIVPFMVSLDETQIIPTDAIFRIHIYSPNTDIFDFINDVKITFLSKLESQDVLLKNYREKLEYHLQRSNSRLINQICDICESHVNKCIKQLEVYELSFLPNYILELNELINIARTIYA